MVFSTKETLFRSKEHEKIPKWGLLLVSFDGTFVDPYPKTLFISLLMCFFEKLNPVKWLDWTIVGQNLVLLETNSEIDLFH